MIIKNMIEDDIVENIFIYKEIYNFYLEIIKINIDSDYNITFDDFCIKFINNFDGVNDSIREYLDKPSGILIEKLYNSVMQIAYNDFKDNNEFSDKLEKLKKSFL